MKGINWPCLMLIDQTDCLFKYTNDMSGGVALNGGQDHQGCNVAIGAQCFNVPGR